MQTYTRYNQEKIFHYINYRILSEDPKQIVMSRIEKFKQEQEKREIKKRKEQEEYENLFI